MGNKRMGNWMLRTSRISDIGPRGSVPPVPGAKAVFFLVGYNKFSYRWVHKGWLMPEVGR